MSLEDIKKRAKGRKPEVPQVRLSHEETFLNYINNTGSPFYIRRKKTDKFYDDINRGFEYLKPFFKQFYQMERDIEELLKEIENGDMEKLH